MTYDNISTVISMKGDTVLIGRIVVFSNEIL